jgi:hypothetical protein
MNAGLMIASILLGIALIKVSLFGTFVCGAAALWFSNKMGAGSESAFLGLILILAVIGVIAPWVQFLLQ